MTEELLEAGRITRAHGLKGEVVVNLYTDRASRLDPGSVLFCDNASLVVASSRRFQGNFLVTFEGVTDRGGAESLRGTLLFAPPLDDPDTVWVHELVGSQVVSTDGQHLGEVEAVEANPASDLLVLNGGRLVPLCFMVEHIPGQRVTVEIPDGLFD